MIIKDNYINNIRQILLGQDTGPSTKEEEDKSLSDKVGIDTRRSKEDSVLRDAIKIQEKFGLNTTTSISKVSSVLPFFSPIKGETSS